jgi:hypothetical protein
MLHDPAEHEPDAPSDWGVWLFMVIVAVFAFFAIPYLSPMFPPEWALPPIAFWAR